MPDHVPPRLPLTIWVLAFGGVILSYGLTFIVVHPLVDTRPCVAQLVDPLFTLIPHDTRWWLVTTDLYAIVTIWVFLEMVAETFGKPDHRPLVRFALGLSIMGLLRCATLVLIPLCKITVAPGTAPLSSVPMVDLGLFEMPFRAFATNDLMFSGHVCEAILFIICTRRWNRVARAGLWLNLILQTYGLLAGRGHYTVDIIVAIPCAFFADLVAVRVLAWGSRSPRFV